MVLFAAFFLVGGSWLLFDRAVTDRAVATDIDEMEELLKRSLETSSLAKAKAVIERAQARLGSREAPALRQRLNQGTEDWKLANRLEQIGLLTAMAIDGKFNMAQGDKDYTEAFRDFGLGQYGDDPETIAARIRNSNIRLALLAALDHWSVVAIGKPKRADWLCVVGNGGPPPARRPNAGASRFR
jgi:hypothetical protein